MISRCIKTSSDDGSTGWIIFKSGFKDLYVIFEETGYETSEYWYHNKRYLLTEFPELESEINQL